MAKSMSPKGPVVKGCNYVEVDEVYDRKMAKEQHKKMKTAGLAMALKKAEKEEGYSKMIRVKPQKKMPKIKSSKSKGTY